MPKDVKQTYKAMIESMDAGIGRVVASLKEHDLDDNTLVIFTSDNGHASRYGGSGGPLRGQKGTVYEGGHRVPMIMRWPVPAHDGIEDDVPMLGMDLLPTLLFYAEIELPQELKLDGINLYGHKLNDPAVCERALHWVHGDKHAIRQGDWKLVMAGKNKPELFNLKDDLGEQNDLADQRPERLKQMQEQHQAWLKEARREATKVSG